MRRMPRVRLALCPLDFLRTNCGRRCGAGRCAAGVGRRWAAVVLFAVAVAAPPSLASAVDLVGRLEVQVAEDFVRGSVRYFAALRTDEGRYPVVAPDAGLAVWSGKMVRVTGELFNGSVSIASIRADASRRRSVADATDTDTLGVQRTLVTLVNFLNDPTQPATVSDVRTQLLDEANPNSTASYYREASYNRTWLSGDVVGWFALNRDDSSCQVWTDSGTQQLVDDLDSLVDFSSVDRWIVVTPQNDSCGFAGISTLGKATYDTAGGSVTLSRAILNGLTVPNLVGAHELGHGFGLLHSVNYECGASVAAEDCDSNGLGNTRERYNLMGRTFFGGHFNAANKDQLGWLSPQIVDVAAPGGTYSLQPYETTGSGTKALRIPVAWNLDDLYGTTYYYVSYRKPLGFDDFFSELATDGAMVHADARRFLGGDGGRSRLLDAKPHLDVTAGGVAIDAADVLIEVGETLVDAQHGVEISITGASGSGLDVSVSISQYCGNGAVDQGIGESCDGADLSAQSCLTLGYSGGMLSCTPACEFDTSACSGARCGPGHAYRVADDTCVATILSDSADTSLWLNSAVWADARSGSTAFGTNEGFLLVHQRIDRSWVYRFSAPFDTSPIPDGRQVFSAELSLKVLSTGEPFFNSHPDSADHLVLVRSALTNPPLAALEDFDHFGLLDVPSEGAPRVDVSNSVVPGQRFTFSLNSEGLSWIDSLGWTTLGIRTGYDVDDVTIPGEEPELRMGLLTSESPVAGPRLVVVYDAGPGTPDGAACGDGILSVFGTEQCDDANTVALDGCDATCQLEFCGDNIVNDAGAEECDDGNTTGLDGCDPRCRSENALSVEQQGCLEALSRGFSRLGVAEGIVLTRCVRKKARRGGSATNCLTESHSKVERARHRLVIAAAAQCASLPDYGGADPANLDAASEQLGVGFVDHLLTSLPDFVMIRREDDRDGARCQAAAMKAGARCQQARLDAFDRCLRAGLEDTIRSESGLEDCMDSDPRGRIARRCGSDDDPDSGNLRKQIEKHCERAAVDLGAALPNCASADGTEVASCLGRGAACRTCLALNQAHGLQRDCEQFDDALANDSCR